MNRLFLSCSLVFQLATLPAAPQERASSQLKIAILEGEGVINNTRHQVSRDLAVQVSDESQRPMPKARVVFTLPSQGASGSFSNHSKTITVPTDDQGRAIVRGFRPNNVAGKLEVRVAATHQGQSATAIITQFNMLVTDSAKKSGSSGKIVAILALVGAAAAGGVVAALRGRGTPAGPATSSIPTSTISPGAGTIGPPR
jgi:hypothetical protein